jgi:hypothetical protein
MAPKSPIIERPLLDNGSVATNPAPLSGLQTRSPDNANITDRYTGMQTKICAVPAVTKRLPLYRKRNP